MPKADSLLTHRIREGILKDIADATLKKGDRLPPEAELKAHYTCSNYPIRRAIDRLVAEGVLEKHHGKGTFVRSTQARPAQTGKIGVFYNSPDEWVFINSYYNAILTGMSIQASAEKKDLVFRSFTKAENGDYNKLILETAAETDGLIITAPFVRILNKCVRTLRSLDKPCLVVGFEESLQGIDVISSDSHPMMTQLVDVLYGLGHRRFAYVGPAANQDHPSVIRRLEGVRAGLKAHGLQLEEGTFITPGFNFSFDPSSFTEHNYIRSRLGDISDTDAEDLRRLMGGKVPPTAFICFSDVIAFQMIAVLTAMGIKVPEEVTVTGYDNLRECEINTPPLTTVHAPLIQMGVRAVKRIVEKEKELRSGLVEHLHTVLKGKIVMRHSHAAVCDGSR